MMLLILQISSMMLLTSSIFTLATATLISGTTDVDGQDSELVDVQSNKRHNEAALLEFLLSTYDSRCRPVNNINTTIFLDLSMYLVQILKLVSYISLFLLLKQKFDCSHPKGGKFESV